MRNWIYISLFTLIGLLPAQAQVSIQDSLALVSLYNATDGANWKNNTNWLQGPVSTWHGVTLQGNRVYVLNMYDNGLNGFVPASIGQLTGIVELDLRKSTFTGGIPDVFGQMSALYQLNLSECGLTGEIPSSLGNCTQLGRLYLAKNQLTGNIPFELSNCINMIILNVRENLLSGSFPQVIQSFPNLQHLDLSHNTFTGQIPEWIGSLSNLYWLYLENIPFEGPMPPLGEKPNLKQIHISHNTVTGNLNEVLSNYPNLEYCTIEQTSLSGLLSPEHFNPQKMVRLYVLNSGIDELGNFSDWINYPNFVHMIISRNHLDFDDLLPNSTMPGNKLLWYPQNPIGRDTIVSLLPGEAYTIFSPMQDEDIQYKWYFNNELINGVENYDLIIDPFTPQVAGDFFFTATHPAFSNFELIGATTTLEEKITSTVTVGQSHLHIFPNPTFNHVTLIPYPGHSLQQVQLYSVDGQLLQTTDVQTHETTLSLQDYPSGLYFLRSTYRQTNFLTRIIKL